MAEELPNGLPVSILGDRSKPSLSVALGTNLELHFVDPLALGLSTNFVDNLVEAGGFLNWFALPVSVIFTFVAIHLEDMRIVR